MLAITNKIYPSFEEFPSKKTRAVFLDLSKAFDSVCHDGLLYGICGKLWSLTCNFLQNRLQRVVLNGKSSEWADISTGIPQSSFLGPSDIVHYGSRQNEPQIFFSHWITFDRFKSHYGSRFFCAARAVQLPCSQFKRRFCLSRSLFI